MPLYEFVCDDCQVTSEILVRSTTWKGTACPRCGSKKLTKNLSVFASHSGTATTTASAPPTCSTNPRRCGACGPHHRH